MYTKSETHVNEFAFIAPATAGAGLCEKRPPGGTRAFPLRWSRLTGHCMFVLAVLPLCLGQSCGSPASLSPDNDEQVAGFEAEPPPAEGDPSAPAETSDEIVDVDPEDRTAAVVAKAGPDIDAQENNLVTLNAGASTGRSTLTFAWKQVSGRAVTLAADRQATCTFTAPAVTVDPELLKFELTVTTRWNGRTYRARDVVWVSVHKTTGGGSGGGGAVLPPLVVPFVNTAPSVDGVLDSSEWADASTYTIDGADQSAPGVVVEGAPTANGTDTSAIIYLKQNTTDLFVGVSVNDDNVVPSAANVWDADAIELFLDADNSNTPGIGVNRLQFDISAGGTTVSTAAVPAGSWSGAAAARTGGYTVEYRLSKTVLGLTAPGTYGFDINVLDVEPAAGTVETGYWYFSQGPGPEGDESQWGDISLQAPAQTPGALAITPAGDLTASGNVGGAFSPNSTSYTLANTGGTPLDWTAAASQSWVMLSKSSGSLAAGASESITVSIGSGANSLPAGNHSGVVTFTNTTNANGNATRSVALTINAASPGTLTVSPANGLASSGSPGGPFTPNNITYTLSNTGGAPVNWTASKTANWVSLLPSGGTLSPGATQNVVVILNSGAIGLPVGNHNDTVTFTNTTAGTVATTRTIGLSITGAGSLSVSPAGGLVSWQNQGSSTRTPSSISYTLSNSGSAPINWTAAKSQTWISLSKTSGTLAAGANDTVVVSYTTAANSLAAGTRTGTVTLTNTTNGAGNGTRSVSLHVVPALTISASPSTGTAPLPVQLTAMAGSSAVTSGQLPTGSTLVWNYGDNTANGNGSQVNHTYSTAGSFLVALTLTLPAGLGSVSCDTHTLQVLASTPAGAMSAASLTSPVNINGTLGASEWTDASSYSMDAGDQNAPGIVVEGSSTGASDASAVVYVKQDATYLYVAVNVTDDNVVQSGANVWNADCVELFLDADNSNTTSTGLDRMQIDVNAGGDSMATSSVPAGSWTTAGAVRSGGYTVEYRLNKSALGLSAGETYGFDVHVYDVEPSAGTVETGYWYYAAGPAPETDESQWGDLILPAFSVAPVIADVPDHNATPGVAYSRTPTLSEGSTPITWSLVTGPSGMNINANTGVVTWSSPGPNGSTHPVTIRAANSNGSDDESWTLTVSAVAPVIADVPNHSTLIGQAYSRTPTLTQGSTPVTWSLVSGPSGMSVNSSTGVVTWSNPTPAGNVTVTIRATNSAGNDDESWTLTVTAVAPVIADIANHNTLAGTSYSRTPTLSQGTTPVTWSLVSGPSGMNINASTGVVTWSNPSAGNANVTIRATNSAGSDDETWTLSVTSSSGQAMTTASRTSGIAPLAVFFDATASNSGVIQPSQSVGGVKNFATQDYVWDFGDPGSGHWTTGRKKSDGTYPSRNEATGYTAAHVFENPGTYQVTLRVTPPGGSAITYTQQINVSAPGTTYYVAATGSDSNNGTSTSTPFRTLSKGLSSLGSGARLLLRAGDTFSTGSDLVMPSGATMGSYGSGNKPVVQLGSSQVDVLGNNDSRIMDIAFTGNSSVTTFDVYGTTNLLLLRISLTPTYSLAGAYGDGIFVVDSVVTNAQLVSFYYHGSRLALLGNNFNRAYDSHNLYLSWVDRGVISSNNIWWPEGTRTAMRIAANHETSRSVTITDNDIDGHGTIWTAIEFGITSGDWDSTQHCENLLFERNTVRNDDNLCIMSLGDYRNTEIRNNEIEGETAYFIDQHVRIPDGSDGPIGLRVHHNTVTASGTWYVNNAPSPQQVYVYQNTVNGQLITGNSPP